MVGYSGTPLLKKLGIKQQMRVSIVSAPFHYPKLLGKLPKGVALLSNDNKLNFLHFFSKSASELKRQFPLLKRRILKDGAIWVSWPKGTSNIETDLNGDLVRKIGLANGLVDIKVCAIDEDWSGLKFVYRRTDR